MCTPLGWFEVDCAPLDHVELIGGYCLLKHVVRGTSTVCRFKIFTQWRRGQWLRRCPLMPPGRRLEAAPADARPGPRLRALRLPGPGQSGISRPGTSRASSTRAALANAASSRPRLHALVLVAEDRRVAAAPRRCRQCRPDVAKSLTFRIEGVRGSNPLISTMDWQEVPGQGPDR